jgi:hypothetical protein
MDPTGADLIFLVSQPRAGSTLLQRVLTGHTQIHTTAEPWLLLHPLYALRQEGIQAEYNHSIANQALISFLDCLPGDKDNYFEAVRQMALILYQQACTQADKPRFLDKTPRYYQILPEIRTLFPQARIILLFRNPLAVFHSILETHVQEHWVLLARYRQDLLTAPFKLLSAQSLPGPVYSLRYEDFVHQPELETKKLCQFLGVNYEPGITNYGLNTPPKGSLGDQNTINRHTAPTSVHLDLWRNLVQNPTSHAYAKAYVKDLGEKTIQAMGYEFETIQQVIATQPTTDRSVKPGWDELMNPDLRLEQRMKWIELALIEHRRLVHKLRRGIRRL